MIKYRRKIKNTDFIELSDGTFLDKKITIFLTQNIEDLGIYEDELGVKGDLSNNVNLEENSDK